MIIVLLAVYIDQMFIAPINKNTFDEMRFIKGIIIDCNLTIYIQFKQLLFTIIPLYTVLPTIFCHYTIIFDSVTAPWDFTYLWTLQVLKVIFHSKLILFYENLLECYNIILLIEH